MFLQFSFSTGEISCCVYNVFFLLSFVKMKATFPGKPTYDLKIFSGILTIFKFICSRLNTLHNSNRVHFRQAFIFNLQHTLLTHTNNYCRWTIRNDLQKEKKMELMQKHFRT